MKSALKVLAVSAIAALLLTGCPEPFCYLAPHTECESEDREPAKFEDLYCPGMGLDRDACADLVSDPDCPTVGPELCPIWIHGPE